MILSRSMRSMSPRAVSRSSAINRAAGERRATFAIDPSGRWLLVANQNSDSVAVFEIDRQSGTLADSGRRLEVGTPMCVKFAVDKHVCGQGLALMRSASSSARPRASDAPAATVICGRIIHSRVQAVPDRSCSCTRALMHCRKLRGIEACESHQNLGRHRVVLVMHGGGFAAAGQRHFAYLVLSQQRYVLADLAEAAGQQR